MSLAATSMTLLLLVPLLAAVTLLTLPSTSGGERVIALGGSLVTAGLAVLVVAGSYRVDVSWIRSLGIRWHFAVDGLSAALVLLAALLTLAVVVGADPPLRR